MKIKKLIRIAPLFLIILQFTSTILFGINISSTYPYYWEYKGQPTLLFGGFNSSEATHLTHYFNKDVTIHTVDQITAKMDEMKSAGGNYIRNELDCGWIGARQGFYIAPKVNGKFDLNTMSGTYWSRLRTFIDEAKKRDIVVGIELWDIYDTCKWNDSWSDHPFNPANNINYSTATSELLTYETRPQNPFYWGVPGHPKYVNAPPATKANYDRVRKYQEKFVDKVLSITLNYDNVLYCMNNENGHAAEWGAYWAKYIHNKASAQGKTAFCTDLFMIEKPHILANQFQYMLDHSNIYNHLDISQCLDHGEDHWTRVKELVDKAHTKGFPVTKTKIYTGEVDEKGKHTVSRDPQRAYDKYWKDLLLGVSVVRFHKPNMGIGLSPASKNCFAATVKLQTKVKLWEVKPRLDLLTLRAEDEVYLAAKPGEKYVLFFPKSGSVGLKLGAYAGDEFDLNWINVDTGNWGPSKKISGGATRTIKTPSAATWVAVITSTQLD